MKSIPFTKAAMAATGFIISSNRSPTLWSIPASYCRKSSILPSGRSYLLMPPSSFPSSPVLRMVHGTGIDVVTPELIGQLAGCAALIGTGKVLQTKEEEEGIEPFEPWSKGKNKDDVDLYRDTWVRYFGYFNEVGEAFRPIIPASVVTFSYIVAFAYILADSYSQGAKVTDTDSGQWRTASVLASIDSLLFQIMASVIFPSFTINRSVAFVGALISQYGPPATAQPEWLEYVPTAIGLMIIPLICPPLDVLTHRLLDNSFRSASDVILRKEEA